MSIERLEDGREKLWVHIADVSRWIRPGSQLSLEAERRMVSVYMPDERISMFPYALSTELLSLGAGVDSYALSCGVTLDEKGRCTSYGCSSVSTCRYDRAESPPLWGSRPSRSSSKRRNYHFTFLTAPTIISIGEVTSFEVCPSKVRVTRRLSYSELDDMLAREETTGRILESLMADSPNGNGEGSDAVAALQGPTEGRMSEWFIRITYIM